MSESKPIYLSDSLIHAVTKIEAHKIHEDGSTEEITATGFYFIFNEYTEDRKAAIITNRHILEGIHEISIWGTLKDENDEPDFGNTHKITLSDPSPHIIFHPNPEIDLAIINSVPFEKIIEKETGKHFYTRPLDNTIVPTQKELESLFAVERVLMIGYPEGIWDELHNTPVFRQGITATPPYLPLNGLPEFLIDCEIQDGCSGSPVLIVNHGSHFNKTENRVIEENRVIFLGILQGEVKVEDDNEEKRSINLGFCIESNQVLAFGSEIEREIERKIKTIFMTSDYNLTITQ